jgi:hypothetical protein
MILSLTYELSGDHPYSFPDRYTGNLKRIENAFNTLMIEISGGDDYFDGSFNDADLSQGILTINHGLNTLTPLILLYNNNREQYFPDKVQVLTANTATLDLSSYLPLIDEWYFVVKKFGMGSTIIRSNDETSITVNGDYTLSINYSVVYVDIVSGVATITVPPPATLTDKSFTIKYIGYGGTVTLDAGVYTIDGQNSIDIISAYKYKKIHSNGLEWYILGEN